VRVGKERWRRKKCGVRMKSGALSETAGDTSREGAHISGREDKRGETHTT
jgi:hypothetical protein